MRPVCGYTNCFALAAALVMLTVAAPAIGATRIELVISVAPGAPLTSAQKWLAALQRAGADGVQIRSGSAGDQPEIRTSSAAAGTSYTVVGVIDGSDELVVPGGRFSRSRIGGIREYLDTLRSEGTDGVTGERGAFGLTEKQLAETREALTQPVRFSTQGQPPLEVANKLADLIGVNVEIETAARDKIVSGAPVPVEVESLTAGMATSAVMRCYGLGMQPRVNGGRVEVIVRVAKAGESWWPVGYELDGQPAQKVPTMFEFLNVHIEDFTLTEVLDALRPRLKVPFVLDHYRMQRDRIDPDEVRVNFPEKRTFYGQVFGRVLFQARLRHELRQDEAGTPFVWITTLGHQ